MYEETKIQYSMSASKEISVTKKRLIRYGTGLLIIMLLMLVVNACSFGKRLKRIQIYPEWSYEIRHITIENGYAFLAMGREGLFVLDVTDPATPRTINSETLVEPGAVSIKVKGYYAYLIDAIYGLRIVDITDPLHSVVMGIYKPDTPAIEVDIQGFYAFLTTGTGGLQVIDISDPANLKEVGVYNTDIVGSKITVSGISTVAVSDQYAYISLTDRIGTVFVEVLNITDPAKPFKVGAVHVDLAGEIVIKEDYAFVTNGIGLQILDISNPSSPTIIASYDTPNFAQGLEVDDNYVYINDLFGVEVVDISNPRSPHRVAYAKLPQVQDIAVVGDYLYVADSELGLVIYERP